jgi:hypothetical protein
MPTKDDNYNVYNEFDSNFVNYGELYKSPREMKQNSKFLINSYADSLVTGGESIIYKDSPYLVGNRYFIDTHTKCLDKNDNSKTYQRSILVDNVNTSALGTTNDKNTGLIYSLLASLKTIDSNDMFNDMSNNQPTEFINNSTDYLKDIENPPLPLCNKITVYSDDKKETDISGWVIDSDRTDIDPKAIKEGFVNISDMMSGSKGKGPSKWGSAVGEVNDAHQAQAEAVAEHAKETANSSTSSANSAQKKGQNAAKNISSKASGMSTSAMASSGKSASDAIAKSRGQGMEKQLQSEARLYLQNNSQPGVVALLKILINLRYLCKGDIEKVAMKQTVSAANATQYAKYENQLKDGSSPSGVRREMINDGIADPGSILMPNGIPLIQQFVYAKYAKLLKDGSPPSGVRNTMLQVDTFPLPKLDPSLLDISSSFTKSTAGKSVRIPSICVYSIFENDKTADIPSIDATRTNLCNKGIELPDISVKNVFASMSNIINKNKVNNIVLDVPGLPGKTVCTDSTQSKSSGGSTGKNIQAKSEVASDDYNKLIAMLYKYRLAIAVEIVRYSNIDAYGQCGPVQEQEGFTTMYNDENLTPYKSNQFANYSAYLFIIAMIFVIFYIVYKLMFRAFNFNRWKIN